MIGESISHYKIVKKLGEGGMGVVYLAEDLKLKRKVAIKFLPSPIAANSEDRQRFEIEAQAAAALNHPNIATIHAIEEVDGQPFIVMEYIAGIELREKVASGPLPLPDILDITLQIAKGLQTAHENGVVHRDIKSANIMFTNKGEVKVMDFGLAKVRGRTRLTAENSTLGTAEYMSPEQVKGREIDHRSDIWSLGIVLFEMITGKPPFRGDYQEALFYLIMNEAPEPVTALRAGVPMELERIVNKALAKKPAERYQRVDEMSEDLIAVKQQLESGTIKKRPVRRMLSRIKPLYRYAGLAMLLGFIVAAVFFFQPEQSVPINSLVVLPLNNLSGDPDQDYFVDGMADALITELSKIETLSVPSRSASMRYKGTDKSLSEIAKELQVGALVEASTMIIGDRVRINVQLIDAERERNMWALDYERDFGDVLSLQKELARSIAREINVQLTSRDEARLDEVYTVHPEAYRLFLRARHLQNNWGLEDEKRPYEYLEESIALDPNYVPAYFPLAQAYIYEGGEDSLSIDESELKARRAAAKAMQLNDQHAEAHLARGIVREFCDWNWSGAEQSFSRALQLDPRHHWAYVEYSWLLMRLGRFEEALPHVEMFHALEQDPLSTGAHYTFAMIYNANGQYDLAIEWCRKALEIDSTATAFYSILGSIYLQKGEYELALINADKFLNHKGSVDSLSSVFEGKELATIGHIYAVAGKRETALRIRDHLQKKWEMGHHWTGFSLATISAGLGEKEEALTWLERLFDNRQYARLVHIKLWTELNSIHDEPRFKAILKKMNFEVND